MTLDKDDAVREAFRFAEHYAAYPSAAAGAFEGKLRELGFEVAPAEAGGATLTYTQHTVAFPTVPMDDSQTDQVNVSLDAKGGGTHGEFLWRFVTFTGMGRGRNAVQLTVFGDGLVCLFDSRIQRVVQQWREMPDPDEMTVDELLGLLRDAGAVPSRYMNR